MVSQNNSYRIIYEEVYPIVQKDYLKAKRIWIKMSRKYTIDPIEELLFLSQSLQHDDARFFKKKITAVMKNYGWQYTTKDTLPESMNNVLLQEIKNHELIEWTCKKSKKHYAKWLTHHKEEFEINKKVNSIYDIDQRITSLTLYDSELDDVKKAKVDSMIMSMDWEHVIQIAQLAKDHGIIPNNFDHGIGVYNKIQLILIHNLKTEDNFHKTWELLFPFLERAYLEGKISYTFFMLYDQWNATHFGVQYYGFMGDQIPVKEQESLDQRKMKYQL